MLPSPPSTGITAPVNQSGASDIIQDAVDATSSGIPILPTGCMFSDMLLEFSFASRWAARGVSVRPGEMTLTLMPLFA